MKLHSLLRETIINRPLKETFSFFSNAENLNLLTPPEVHFKIISTLPIKMEKGTFIEYRIKLNGIGFYWKTEITEWEKHNRFVDTQIKGPYKIWIHEHRFYEKEDKTLMIDHVQFLSPGWIFEPIIHKYFINKKVSDIFDYRSKQLGRLFP